MYDIFDKIEFISKYGHVKVLFHSYYKHRFTFAATLEDGDKLIVSYGRNAKSIYSLKFNRDDAVTVNVLSPDYGTIYRKGAIICVFDEAEW